MITTVLPRESLAPRRPFEPRELPHLGVRGRRRISWHYGRGDREQISCTACCLGRGYEFRVFASTEPGEVHRFASAADLLDCHASIERQLFAAGWHLVRFTHEGVSQAFRMLPEPRP